MPTDPSRPLHELPPDPGIRAQARRWQALFDNPSLAIAVTDARGRFVAANPRLQALIGYTEAELLRLRVDDVTAPHRRRAVQAALGDIASGRLKELRATLRLRRKDGSSVWARIDLSAVGDGDGDGGPAASVAIVQDLGERRRADAERLHLARERASGLVAMKRLHELSTRLLAPGSLPQLLDDALACAVALTGADCGCLQLYEQDSDTLRLVAHGDLPRPLAEGLAAAADIRVEPHRRAMLQGQRLIVDDLNADPAFGKHRAAAADARMRALQTTPLMARHGELIGSITTWFDRPHRPSDHELQLMDLCAQQAGQLIERKRTDAALRRSRAYLAEGEYLSRTGSWAWNAVNHSVYWSPGQYAIFGLDPAGVVDRRALFGPVHADDAAGLQQRFDDAVRSHAGFEGHYRIKRPDGALRHIQSRAHAVIGDGGALIEYVGTAMDITEGRRSEEALARLQAELAHVTRVLSMGELAASIAHEISQPLAAIVTNGNACLRWIARRPPDLGEATLALEHIVRDGLRAGNVIGGIRAFTRKAAPRPYWFDLNEAVGHALSLAAAELRRNDVAVLTDIANDLPPVHGDRVQLQQVVLNLIMNGIDSMKSTPSSHHELTVRSRIEAGDVIVSVRDSGSGLAAKAAARLFDPFFTTKPNGMGLGLAISKRIVEAHGGELWATSPPGQGATVAFRLPARGGPEKRER